MTARWRTKTGCLTCRKRRKKCDERTKGEGSCTACARNNIACVWPGQEAKDRSRNRPHDAARHALHRTQNALETADGDDACNTMTLSSPNARECTNVHDPQDDIGFLMKNSPFRPSVWHEVGPNTQYRCELFKHFSVAVAGMMIRCDSHPGFTDWTATIREGLQHPCLMDVFLACSAIHLSHTRPEMRAVAFSYYSSAVSNTRLQIERGQLDGSEEWLLILVCYLAIFERFQPESSSKAALHLQGAVHLMSLKRAKVGQSVLPSIAPHQRLWAESVIYNTTFTAFLSPDVSWLSHMNVWEQVDVFCQANPYPGTSEDTISPLMGVAVKLYHLILQVSCLARRLPWSAADALRANRMRDELDSWVTDAELDNGNGVGGLSWISAKLFVFAADILLFKAMNADVSPSHPHIRRRVAQSLDLLRRTEMTGTYWSQHFCWPAAILACAVEQKADFLFLQQTVDTQWRQSFFGDVRRTGNILQAMWEKFWDHGARNEFPRSLESSSSVDADRMNLLLCREGICSLLEEASDAQRIFQQVE